jgi:class 3 adenylate cyclase
VRETRATERQLVQLRIHQGRFTPRSVEVDAGPLTLEVTNDNPKRAAVTAINLGAGRLPPRAELPRFLTAKQLFVTQTFSELFRSETVNARQGLALKDLTFVFTDLKGSTELYETIGDLQAFHLVGQHFDRLDTVIRAHRGAIVKTIGDAVMAAFGSAADALAGSLDMLRAIEAFNRERGKRDIVLKVGVHRGASIAVTLNDRLDYFGQTINIAARVQGIAGPGEICFTDEVLASPGVRDLLETRQVANEDAQLKGITRAVRVHRLAQPA